MFKSCTHTHPCLIGLGARGLVGLVFALLLVQPAGAIPCLSGFVRDGAGNLVAGGDLDFNISATGQRIVTPGDNTDATGFYTVCVLPNVYDVAFAPPDGTRLMGKLVPGVDLTADIGRELDVVLDIGIVVSGTARDAAGVIVGNVDVDVDRVEGGRLYTPGDDTDPLTGIYRVVIPNGRHRLRFEPPPGSRLRGVEIDSVVVAGDMTIDVDLEEGVLLEGRVVDELGAGVPEVDIDFRYLATGEKLFVANNGTDALGNYTVAAPGGEFELRYTPPRTSHQVAVAIKPFSLTGDLVRDQTLSTGFLVAIDIRGPDGLPLVGADLDVKDQLTGAKLFVPHDRSDTGGRAVAVVPAGTYELTVDPPLGASMATTVLTGVQINGDATIQIDLEEAARVTVTGRVLDDLGGPVDGATLGARLVATGEEVRIPNDTTRPDGTFALDVPPTELEFSLAPPTGTRLVARRLANIAVAADTTLGDLSLAVGILVDVTVTESTGAAIPAADLDFFDSASGTEIYTPRDNTDSTGRVVVAVPAGTYRVVVTPSAQSGFDLAVLTPVPVFADTSLAVTLEKLATGLGQVAIESGQPNPFGDMLRVGFRIALDSDVTLAVYDIRGRLVRIVSRGFRAAGAHTETWDGRNDAGSRAPSGVYLIRLQSRQGDATRRVLLIH